ncbi:MAG: phosphoenolpyruvate--protein phosphotransferase [Alphaproteobacteria bacterium]|nr:phosphoenolpyruvate--protein phosphotransferase [Alphaproteobacteria bacterium]
MAKAKEKRHPGRKGGAKKAAKERRLTGLGVSAGIAIGRTHVREIGAPDVPEYRIPKAAIAGEQARFEAAVVTSRRQVDRLRTKTEDLPPAAAEEMGFLLDAHGQMLSGSRLTRGVAERISRDALNAEAAVQAVISEIAHGFAAMEDAYLAARIDDIREVGNRLIRNLTDTPYQAFSRVAEGSVIIAEELTPADTALLDPAGIAGFATILGGVEGHTAIMARSLGLPAVLGVPGLVGLVEPGATVIVDGTDGVVIVDPGDETVADYTSRGRAWRREERNLARLGALPAITLDDVAIRLQANVELPREMENAVRMGAEGVGLLRTEFLYMNRDTLPDEEEQYQALREVVGGMGGPEITMRTLDVGGDKLAYSLGGHIGESVNPALGLRAIRLSLKDERLLDAQLAAMLRAGAHGPIRVLLPMISNLGELKQVRERMKRVAARLNRRRVKFADPLPPLGVMIEVPGAALAADALAHEADFFAIGTNDLTMYTLAIDRGDDQVAHLYNPLHPAVLRLIQFSTEAALRARIPVCLCGEMAGDARYTALLLGLGIRDLSMTAQSLPRVKQRIRNLDLNAATRRARLIMDQWDYGRIATLLDDFNALA